MHGVQHASDPALEDSKLLDFDVELRDEVVHLLLASASHTRWVALTTQVTSIGDIGPYRAPGRRVWKVSYQLGSETLLSGLYRTYCGPNHYAM